MSADSTNPSAPAGSFGALATRLGFLSQNKLMVALQIQRDERANKGRARRLGEILVTRGYLTEAQVGLILKLQTDGVSADKPEDKVVERKSNNLGALATRLGYLTAQQLAEALEIQREDRAIGYDRPIGEILVANGALSEAQVAVLLKLQKGGLEAPVAEAPGAGPSSRAPSDRHRRPSSGAIPAARQRPSSGTIPARRPPSSEEMRAAARQAAAPGRPGTERAAPAASAGPGAPGGGVAGRPPSDRYNRPGDLAPNQAGAIPPVQGGGQAGWRGPGQPDVPRPPTWGDPSPPQGTWRGRLPGAAPDAPAPQGSWRGMPPTSGEAPPAAPQGSWRGNVRDAPAPQGSWRGMPPTDAPPQPPPQPPPQGTWRGNLNDAPPQGTWRGHAPVPGVAEGPGSQGTVRGNLMGAAGMAPGMAPGDAPPQGTWRGNISGETAPPQGTWRGNLPPGLEQHAAAESLASMPRPAPGVHQNEVPQALPQIPGYTVVSRLGQGGVGVVYKAHHATLGNAVAIKILRPAYSRQDAFRKRFFREARTCARLNHLNIVRGIDAGQVGSLCFMVMEYVEGFTLQKLISDRTTIPTVPAIEIACQVADALGYAWSLGMVHRDLKPENVMIVSDGDLPVGMALKRRAFTMKLMDLGLAKAVIENAHEADGNITQVHQAIGTPKYMSPEQAQGKEVDIRSDIYSLGVTLFECLTGEAPFDGPSAMSIMISHVRDPVPDPRSRVPSMPDDLAEIIRRCMSKDPANRFATPADVRAALHAVSVRLLDPAKAVNPGAAPAADSWRAAGREKKVEPANDSWRAAARDRRKTTRERDIPAPPGQDDLRDIGERLRDRRAKPSKRRRS